MTVDYVITYITPSMGTQTRGPCCRLRNQQICIQFKGCVQAYNFIHLVTGAGQSSELIRASWNQRSSCKNKKNSQLNLRPVLIRISFHLSTHKQLQLLPLSTQAITNAYALKIHLYFVIEVKYRVCIVHDSRDGTT